MPTVCKFIKNFLILSSRPKKSEEEKIKHHLYGFISVKKHFSTGDWLNLAKKRLIFVIDVIKFQ